jgi:hypothetical protein
LAAVKGEAEAIVWGSIGTGRLGVCMCGNWREQ